MNINGYIIDDPKRWKTMGGNGECNFATKDGQRYFLKRMIHLKYPLDDTEGWTDKKREEVRQRCDDWLRVHRELSEQLPGRGIGTLVKPVEYFRSGIYLYEVTHEICIAPTTYKNVYQLNQKDRILLMMTVARTLADVHAAGFVHADLNPENILLSISEAGKLIGHLIDFTDSFRAKEPPEKIMSKEYWCSPEIMAYSEDHQKYREYITGKADVFSLGIIFHQYCTQNGKGPDIKYDYPFIDVLERVAPKLDSHINPSIQKLISEMLSLEPDNRPSMEQVYKRLFYLYAGKEPSRSNLTAPIQIVAGSGKSRLGLPVSVASLIQAVPAKVKIEFSDGSYQVMDLALAEKCGYVVRVN